MYKIYSGKKCVTLTDKPLSNEANQSKTIIYISAQQLHDEYNLLHTSTKYFNLYVVGNVEIIWNVFRSLFVFIQAAGGVVSNKEGKVLMIYRNKHWDIPKGKMEHGEIPEQTAVREVEEECGVKGLTITRDLLKTYHTFFQDGKDCLKCTHWFEMSCTDTSDLVPQKEEGITKAEWKSKAEVKKVYEKIFPSLQDVLKTASFLSS